MAAKLVRLLQVSILALMMTGIAFSATGNKTLVLLLQNGQSKKMSK